MGCYDSVMVPCPKCGTISDFQSKSGECLLKQYTLQDCPEDVLSDVNRHAPNKCHECGVLYYVEVVRKSAIWPKEWHLDAYYE